MRTRTYYFRNFVNSIVDSTLESPSLAEMVHHHLSVNWVRQHHPPYQVIYRIYDDRESFLEVDVTDARGYADRLYIRGLALLKIGVNGALVSPDDESYAEQAFEGRPFRTCPYCRQAFSRWLDFYGHIKTNHWTEQKAI